MLDLNDPRWAELRHAYGSASDVPHLLRALSDARPSESATDEPWHSLWSSLCHQGDVYTASYAALPHLVAAAIAATDLRKREQLAILAACIEVERRRRPGPEVPAYLQRSHAQAVRDLGRIAADTPGPWDDLAGRSFGSALLASRGNIALAAMLIEMPEEEVCPECGARVPIPFVPGSEGDQA